MKVEQIYTNCLAEAAYYIASEGEVAIIDPLREPTPYLQKAKRDGGEIKYIFETHFHADFVSGHLDLAQKTGATIVFGPGAQPAYEAHIAQDGEIFRLGKLSIKVLHTPGHTMESVTYLLLDAQGKAHCIFTGDTLFIGDVGRPDLAVSSTLTSEDLAGHLFDSLHNKIMPLPNEVIVYPGHGAGSACGKNMSKETFDTLGHQKKMNYALNPALTKAQFVKEVTNGLAAPPQYFPKNVALNKAGYKSIDEVLEKGLRAIEVADFAQITDDADTLLLDTRTVGAFAKGFIKGSLFIGIDGGFAPWVGTLIENLTQKILIIADEGRAEEVVTRLARVGYDNPVGYLKGGFDAWKKANQPFEKIEEITAEQLIGLYEKSQGEILDVRTEKEFAAEHLARVENIPLNTIKEAVSKLEKTQNYYIHCAGGYRSLIFASILKKAGFSHVFNVKGGYSAIKNTPLPRIS